MDYRAEACAKHYEDQQNAADRMDAEIQARVDELTKPGGKFYPWSQQNFVEAISEMSSRDYRKLCEALTDSDALKTGSLVSNAVKEYWEKWARIKAESNARRGIP